MHIRNGVLLVVGAAMSTCNRLYHGTYHTCDLHVVQVIQKLRFRTLVHYCAYGASIKKPTMLFSSFNLTENGLTKKLCKKKKCLALVNGRHKRWVKTSRSYRQSIPELLSTQVGRAISGYMTACKCRIPRCMRKMQM